ncbi:tRNA pseudouridine(38-40) synthase TruA [Erysipelothrix aquatica]|uniref:tRNA pseudouridine(38-40) synthase TruA n=1 Tax=Erysipelothrix aquatica TaxID=2683714 RepID=UPI00135A3587|nr:tRNA pseudouridine(38-40) synthase TruA [Erysipelothrix aquatica]
MRYKVTVAYDGSAFSGWQKQPSKDSVQDDIEGALKRLHRKSVPIHGSGRTDTQVHALAQVFHFDSDINMPITNWIKALNTQTSDAINILKVESVDDTFHARHDAIAKTYVYRINVGPYNVFERNYVYQFNNPLNLSKIEEAMEYIVGEHDFTSFNSSPLDLFPNQIRTVHSFDMTVSDDILEFRITGTGFLRYMVRMIIASMVMVGSEKISPDTVKMYRDAKDKDIAKHNVPGCGLYLEKVTYNS